MEDIKTEYEQSKKEVVNQLKAYIGGKGPKKEPIPRYYYAIGVAVVVVFVIMVALLLKKDDRARKQVKEFSYDDYFMQSTKKDVERQKVYSIDDISRTVSGRYKEQEVMQKAERKAEEGAGEKDIKASKKRVVVVKEEKKEEKPREAKQFVVFVNQSEKDKERERAKGKGVLGVQAGAVLDAVVKNEVRGEMPITLRTTADYTKDGEVIIPADSSLFGETKFNRKSERVDIIFKALIVAGGRSYKIKAMALDEKGQQPGVYAQVDKKFEYRAGGRAAGEMLGKVARIIPGVGGVGGIVGTGIDSVTKEAGRDAKDFERQQNIEFTVRAGEKVKVVFEEAF